MASSISSERAFSAGMTITKCRNRLKADLCPEALQVLRFMFQKDLIFREPAPTSLLEIELEEELLDEGGHGGDILMSDGSDIEN